MVKNEKLNHWYYDLVPKGVQEKRTEVLENKVYRMWVSNAFFEWTREVIHQWREKAVLLFVPDKFDCVICDKVLNITHYNKPTSLCY